MPMESFTKTRTTTFQPEWVKRDWLKFGDYQKARLKTKIKIQKTCFKCRHKFDESEQLAIVSLGRHGNKLFCDNCAATIEATDTKESQ